MPISARTASCQWHTTPHHSPVTLSRMSNASVPDKITCMTSKLLLARSLERNMSSKFFVLAHSTSWRACAHSDA